MKRKTENQKTRRQLGRISLKNLMLENQPVDAEGNKIPFQTVQSQVYPIRLLRLSYEMENYFLNNAWSVAAGNDDIMGIGLFVEPYMFDPAVKDYSQYVGPNEAASHTAKSYGAYETYGQNDFYQGAVRTQQPYFTNPYVDQGVTMVTASYPVVRRGVTQCVIVVDINEDNFAKVRSSHPKYDTMYANIFTNDSTPGLRQRGQDLCRSEAQRDDGRPVRRHPDRHEPEPAFHRGDPESGHQPGRGAVLLSCPGRS